MSRLLSRVANPIHLRQFLVKCVKQAGQPPLFRDFAAPWGIRSLSKTTFWPFCPFSPAGGSRMCQVHHNMQRKIFFAKKFLFGKFFPAHPFPYTQKPPTAVKNSHGRGCFFFMPVYSALRQRRGQGASARQQGRLQIRTFPRPCPPQRCTRQSVRRAKGP